MRPRSALAGALALALAACGGDKLHKTLPPNVHVDTYNQQGASAVDVLWIVDNSGSMQPFQANVAQNFDSFIKLFTRGNVDYRIAVTTTDIFHQQGQFVCGPSSCPAGSAIISPSTPDVIGTFETNIQVGINGSANSEGLAAAQLSIDTQTTANATLLQELQSCQGACATGDTTCQQNCQAQFPIQFYRPGAYLDLIFVQDDDDESPGDAYYYYRVYAEAKGPGNDGTVTTAGITGTQAVTNCGAHLGARYLQVVQLTNGEYGDICDPSFADTLKRLSTNAIGLKRKFALSTAPNVQTIAVTLKYPCNEPSDVLSQCASTDDSACAGQGASSVNLVCTPVQGGTDGWSYESDTNVIYFAGNSLPDLNAEIDIEYYVAGTSP